MLTPPLVELKRTMPKNKDNQKTRFERAFTIVVNI